MTSSPICASTRRGAVPRSWVRLHEVNASYYSPAPGSPRPLSLAGIPSDLLGLGRGLWLEDQYALHQPRRLVPNSGQRHPRCSSLSLQYSEHQLGQGEQRAKAYGVLSDCVYGGIVAAGTNTQLQPDQRLGHQCWLRALLDPGLAYVAVRRLLRGVIWQRAKAAVTPFCARMRGSDSYVPGQYCTNTGRWRLQQ